MLFYTIECKINDGSQQDGRHLILDIPRSSTEESMRVQMYVHPPNSPSGSRNQQWLIEPRARPYSFSITNRATGQALTAVQKGAPVVQQFQRPNDDGQFWSMDAAFPPPDPIKVYSFLGAPVNALAGPVLDLPLQDKGRLGATIQVYDPNPGDNQLWRFVPGHDIPTFVIVCRANRKVLDIPGFNSVGNSPINQYQYNGGPNQIFEFIRVGTAIQADDHPTGIDADPQPQVGGIYYIRSLFNGKFLSFQTQGANDQRLLQSDGRELENYQWVIEAGQRDSFRFRNRDTGTYISAPDNSNDGGQVWAKHDGATPNGASQEWWPKRVDTFSIVPGIVDF
jgi:hypothetical protein